MSDKFLIPVETLVPEDIFKQGGTDPIIKLIKEKVESFERPDISSAKGRAAIVSLAYDVARSKTFIDDMGKKVKEKYQSIIKPIDAERKKVRDELDALKDQVRKPVTDWEIEQERTKAEKKAREQFEKDWDAAIIDNDIVNRERELARREAELKRQEEEQRKADMEHRGNINRSILHFFAKKLNVPPEYIMQEIRQRRGLDKNDKSEDSAILLMSPMEKLKKVVAWNLGSERWADEFLTWARDCGIDDLNEVEI